MVEYRFTVEGKPQAKQRPRATMIHGYNRIYTPRKTAKYEKAVAISYKAVGGKCFDADCEIAITVDVLFVPPSRLSKAKREELIGKACIKHNGDLDNIVKSVLDGLNGVAYVDDTQVVNIYASKRYGETDCVNIVIRGGR